MPHDPSIHQPADHHPVRESVAPLVRPAMDAARIDPRLAGSPVSRSLSLLPASSGQRVLAAGGLVALLWLLVWWALD